MRIDRALCALLLLATRAHAGDSNEPDRTPGLPAGEPVEVTMTYTMDEHCRPKDIQLEQEQDYKLDYAFTAGLADAWAPRQETVPLRIAGTRSSALHTAEGAVCLKADKKHCGPLKCYFDRNGTLQRAVFGGQEVTKNGRLQDLFITRVRFAVSRNP